MASKTTQKAKRRKKISDSTGTARIWRKILELTTQGNAESWRSLRLPCSLRET